MTETSMIASKTLFRHEEHNMVFLTLTAGVAIKAGQSVRMKAATNLTVEVRTLGTDFPIGICTVGDASGARVTIATVFSRTVKAIAKGGTIPVGSYVIPNGTFNAVGLPEYIITSTAGHFVEGVVISGGAVDTEIVVGLLRAPFKF